MEKRTAAAAQAGSSSRSRSRSSSKGPVAAVRKASETSFRLRETQLMLRQRGPLLPGQVQQEQQGQSQQQQANHQRQGGSWSGLPSADYYVSLFDCNPKQILRTHDEPWHV